jgi:2-methylisocitrate lyase-like PEP mutase family enzyme
MADYERVGRELRGALLSASIFETPGMPWPTPKELGELGFGHVSYPASLIFRITQAMSAALAQLRAHAEGTSAMTPDPRAGDARQLLDHALQLAEWQRIEHDFSDSISVGRRS